MPENFKVPVFYFKKILIALILKVFQLLTLVRCNLRKGSGMDVLEKSIVET